MQSLSASVDLPENPALDLKSRLALGISAMALVLGILADGLLRVGPWGLNFPLWMFSLAGAVLLLMSWQQRTLSRVPLSLVALSAAFAAGCAWRDSPTLKVLDVGAALLLLALAAWTARGGRLWSGHLSDYARGLIQFGMESLLGLVLVLGMDLRWKDLPRRRWLKLSLSILVGLALAVPVLLVFGGLLSAADAAFHKVLVELFDFDLELLFGHAFLTLLGAWLACGWLRGLTAQEIPLVPTIGAPRLLRLGLVETGIVLGCLNLLFLGFIVVQFQHFFGGAAQVEVIPGLTYAEYARRGFFELVTVAALVLPLLLLADWLLREERRRALFSVLAGSLVVMLFIIMASAMQRMRLYQHEYGLTELRLYVTAFMGWLAVVFVWFLATVLPGRRPRFAAGALAGGLGAIVLLHALNPDALIVRVNGARAARGEMFDARYATSLSADALPALAKFLPSLPPAQQRLVRSRLTERWAPVHSFGWRTASWSRGQARQAMAELAGAGNQQPR